LDRKLVDLLASRLAQRYGDRASEFVRERLAHAEDQADAVSVAAWQDIATSLKRLLDIEAAAASPAAVAKRSLDRAADRSRRREVEGAASGLTVLVVDDEPEVRDALVRILTPQRYNVVFADSGAEALRVIDQGIAPDLVLSDVVMPGMNGFNLAHLARQRWPQLKFLFLTGYAERVSAIDGDSPQLGKVLRKPIMPSHLRQEVAALIG